MSDAALAASIGAIGILQPPAVTEKDGELTISYGGRRVRMAIAIGLPEIDVLVKDPDDRDNMRPVSENVVRAPMATVDLWRAIESLASENWTEEAIAAALDFPSAGSASCACWRPSTLRSSIRSARATCRRNRSCALSLGLARGPGGGVEEAEAEKGQGAVWWQIAQALQKTRFFARDAKFGEAEREAFGIVWQEDLFAEGDEDNRFTVDGEAFVSAQRAWVDANMPKNGVWIEIDEYGREKLPPRAKPTWTKPKKGDQIGFSIHPRDGTVHEVVFRVFEPEVQKGKGRLGAAEDDAPPPKKTRPEITHKGNEIIGALRTEALVKSLEVNACDDMTLIGLLVLALNARNVTVQTNGPTRSTRTTLVQSITEGGRLTHDAERLRVVARQMLSTVLSCSLGQGDSGLVARIAGDALGADVHIGDMATEDFLSCLSKAAIEKVGSSLRVLPRPRVKDTRAEVIKQAAGTTYVHPAAPLRSDRGRARAPRRGVAGIFVGAGRVPNEDHQDEVGIEAEPEGEASASTDDDRSMSSIDPSVGENGEGADENAHLEDDLEQHGSRPDRRQPWPSFVILPGAGLESGAWLSRSPRDDPCRPYRVRPRPRTPQGHRARRPPKSLSPRPSPRPLHSRRPPRLSDPHSSPREGAASWAMLSALRDPCARRLRRIASPSISFSIASARPAVEIRATAIQPAGARPHGGAISTPRRMRQLSWTSSASTLDEFDARQKQPPSSDESGLFSCPYRFQFPTETPGSSSDIRPFLPHQILQPPGLPSALRSGRMSRSGIQPSLFI